MAIAVERIEVFNVECASGVPKNAPTFTSLTFTPAYVVGLTLVIPAGHAGLTGIGLTLAGTRVIPWTTGAFLEGDNETINWELTDFLNTGSWGAETYNVDTGPHLWQIRFLCDEVVPKPSGKPIVILTKEGAVAAVIGRTTRSEGLPEPGEPGAAAPPAAEPVSEAPEEPSAGGPTVEEEQAQEVKTEEPKPEEPAPPPTETPQPPAEAPAPPAETPPGAPSEPAPEPAPAPPPGEAAAEAPAAAETPPPAAVPTAAPSSPAKPGVNWNVPDTLAGHNNVDQAVATVVNVIMHQVAGLKVSSTGRTRTAAGVPAGRDDRVALTGAEAGAHGAAQMATAAAYAAALLAPYLTEGVHNPGLSVRDGRTVPAGDWGGPAWTRDKLYLVVAVDGSQRTAVLDARAKATTREKPKGHPTPGKPKGKPGKQPPAKHGKPPPPKRGRPAAPAKTAAVHTPPPPRTAPPPPPPPRKPAPLPPRKGKK